MTVRIIHTRLEPCRAMGRLLAEVTRGLGTIRIALSSEHATVEEWTCFAESFSTTLKTLSNVRILVSSEYCGLASRHAQSCSYAVLRAFVPYLSATQIATLDQYGAGWGVCCRKAFTRALAEFGSCDAFVCVEGTEGELGANSTPYRLSEHVVHEPLRPHRFDEKACFFERFEYVPTCNAGLGMRCALDAGHLIVGSTPQRARKMQAQLRRLITEHRSRCSAVIVVKGMDE